MKEISKLFSCYEGYSEDFNWFISINQFQIGRFLILRMNSSDYFIFQDNQIDFIDFGMFILVLISTNHRKIFLYQMSLVSVFDEHQKND